MSNPKVEVRNRGAAPQEALLENREDLLGTADIIRRRLESRAPFSAGGSIAIKLKNPNLVCRWFNSDKNPDHIWRAKNNLGWAPVTEDMVADLEQLGGYNLINGAQIVRGERSKEHLMCMPKDAYQEIQKAKTAANDSALGSSRKTKDDIVRAAESALGDEAASFIRDNVFGEVTDMVERTPLEHDVPEQ